MKSKIFNIAALVCGLSLLAWIIWDTGPAELLQHLMSVGWRFSWVVAVYLAETLLEVGAWQLMVPKHRRTGFMRMFAVSQAGAAMNGLLPGQAGEVLKGTLLRGHVKTRWIVSSLLQYNFLFIATTLPVLVVCSLVVLASGCLPMSVSLLLFAGVLVSAVLPTVLFIWIRRGMVGDILAVIKKLPLVGRMVKDSLIEEGRKIDHEIRSVWKHRPQDFILASALLTAARFLAITEVWLILFLMNKTVPVPIAGAIFAASQVFSYVLMFLPTSFGVLEGGAKGIFKWFALDGDVGLSMELVRRIRKFFFMFVGLACLGVLAIVDPGVKKIIKTPEGGETSEEDMGDE